MFGRHRDARPVQGPADALAPFRIVGADPDEWVHVPLHFPTPEDKDSWAWVTRQAERLRARQPAYDKNSARGLFLDMATQPEQQRPGHDDDWVTTKTDELPHRLHLPVFFDVVSTTVEALSDRLVQRSDQAFQLHPRGYTERPVAPARWTPVRAAGLGAGRCVVRLDSWQILTAGSEKIPGSIGEQINNPDYWPMSVSVHWMFAGAGSTLRASTRTDDRRLLTWAMPRVGRLLDAVTVGGRSPVEMSGPPDRAAEAVVAEVVATADRHEQEVAARRR